MITTIDVDLWIWSLSPPSSDLARYTSLLSEDERTRADRFLSSAHAASYTAGRGRMREVLATYTGQSPAHLRFDYGASGKPSLADGLGVRPHFNLSHTVDLAALAITVDHPLGVDIERVRPLKEDIAGRFFSPAEVAALGALPVDARETAFYRCWTRKEAFVKATGHGLGFPLDSFDVTLTADAPAILRIAGQSPQQVALWRLLHFDAAPGVVGAIALRSTQPDDRVNLRLRR